ncbi:glycosyltransferase family 2 protein [Venturia nashicola]|uniref:Glycosyltransferase family 2 protein n=1 Tax=Venturia nashicola TaxID=86259 RepID=A0A4Z1PDC4_9PEZI|nr:glycosyltransferase family 2 protein [Venturia nashicola]
MEVLGYGMASTAGPKDLSENMREDEVKRKFRQQRSGLLLRALDYSHIFSPMGLALCFVVSYYTVSRYLLIRTVIDSSAWWTPDSLVCVILGLSSTLTSLPPFGYAIAICWPIRSFELVSKPKIRQFDRLFFCLVTRGENVDTILCTIENWPKLRQVNSRIRFQIIIDREIREELKRQVPDFVEVLLVPKDFAPPKAMYKARALEFARLAQQLTSDDWVLHLDEETQLDEFAVRACLDFIERGDRHFAMGTILYNSVSHWSSSFLTVGEIARITDDFGRFRLPFKLRHRPHLGYIHGSFIMINGEIENAITWDTNCMTEDFWFGYRAANRGYKFGWLNAIAREQPPRTINDVWAQRKRWFSGIWACNVLLARLSYIGCVTFLISLAYHGYVIFIREEPLIIPRWMFIWGIFGCGEGMWATIVSTTMQDFDHGGISVPAMVWHVVQAFALTPIFRAMESCIVVDAILFPPKSFHVVAKV